MNRQIKILGVAMMVLFTGLFAQLNYLQIFHANALNNHPDNKRNILRDFSQPRGVIQTADGVVLARSDPTGDEFKRQRVYPEGKLFAHVTGFLAFNLGATGVERTYNDALSGQDQKQTVSKLSDLLVKKEKVGNVTLTLNKHLQDVATEQLGDRKGAVVAIDPKTGGILAFADFPTYDPNPLSSHDLSAAQADWEALNADPENPLLSRAYRERYPPGSSFKVVTSSVGLSSGEVTLTKPVYPQLSSLPLPNSGGQSLSNFGGGTCGGPLPDILRVSCNTAFAQMGMDLGAARMSDGAGKFGFRSVPPIDLPEAAESVFPPATDFAGDEPGLAKSAIGQQDVAATPLQMALVAAGIANNGTVMTPHVMSEIRDGEGELLQRFEPTPWQTAVTPDVAHTMRDLMVNVVARGTGAAAQIPGVAVAGKTGTAQTGLDTVHVWFVSFAPAADPKIAVAVMLENRPVSNEETGGQVAAPIAKAVMEAALSG